MDDLEGEGRAETLDIAKYEKGVVADCVPPRLQYKRFFWWQYEAALSPRIDGKRRGQSQLRALTLTKSKPDHGH